jgi:hypothetical protein
MCCEQCYNKLLIERALWFKNQMKEKNIPKRGTKQFVRG